MGKLTRLVKVSLCFLAAEIISAGVTSKVVLAASPGPDCSSLLSLVNAEQSQLRFRILDEPARFKYHDRLQEISRKTIETVELGKSPNPKDSTDLSSLRQLRDQLLAKIKALESKEESAGEVKAMDEIAWGIPPRYDSSASAAARLALLKQERQRLNNLYENVERQISRLLPVIGESLRREDQIHRNQQERVTHDLIEIVKDDLTGLVFDLFEKGYFPDLTHLTCDRFDWHLYEMNPSLRPSQEVDTRRFLREETISGPPTLPVLAVSICQGKRVFEKEFVFLAFRGTLNPAALELQIDQMAYDRILSGPRF